MAKKKEKLETMKDADLLKEVSKLKEEIRETRFKGPGATQKNVKSIKNNKRQIARILTELNKRSKTNK